MQNSPFLIMFIILLDYTDCCSNMYMTLMYSCITVILILLYDCYTVDKKTYVWKEEQQH